MFDMLGLPLMLIAGRPEVDAAKESGHQKLVVPKLGNQRAPLRRRIRPRDASAAHSVRHHRVPGIERQRLREIGYVAALEEVDVRRFGYGLELAFEIEAGDLPLYRSDQPVIH